MFENKISLGIFSGILANTLANIFSLILYFTGIKEYFLWTLATSIFVSRDKINNLGAIILGIVADSIIAIWLGILLVYILYIIGTNRGYLKGLIYGGLWWIILYGGVTGLHISRLEINSIDSNLAYLAEHLIFGILLAWFNLKFGKKVFKDRFRTDWS